MFRSRGGGKPQKWGPIPPLSPALARLFNIRFISKYIKWWIENIKFDVITSSVASLVTACYLAVADSWMNFFNNVEIDCATTWLWRHMGSNVLPQRHINGYALHNGNSQERARYHNGSAANKIQERKKRVWNMSKGEFAPIFASESVSLLPKSPAWPEIHRKLRATREERESERSQISQKDFFWRDTETVERRARAEWESVRKRVDWKWHVFRW